MRKRARHLPPYVTAFTDRHGKIRHRYRRKGFEGGYFKSPLPNNPIQPSKQLGERRRE